MSVRPAIDGWFTTGDAPALLGSQCTTCTTTCFPPVSTDRAGFCRNPACAGAGIAWTDVDLVVGGEAVRNGYGATQEDFARVKVKNARHGLANPYARYRKEVSAEDVLASAVVADPLHLLDICATSDGAAAVLIASTEYAKRAGLDDPVRIRAVSTVTPTFPHTMLDMPDLSTDAAVPGSGAGVEPERTFKESIAHAAYGEAEALLRAGDTALGGRLPVNPSGGPSCFGEAVPAQALAQVCEVTWQLRGRAAGRQVDGAKVGITANQGLFGHGSSVILSA